MSPPRFARRSRRRFLASLGIEAAALAGCLGRDGGHDSDYPTVRREVGEPFETRSGLVVTVANPRLRKAVVGDEHTHPVLMAPDDQFVVVDVETDEPTETGRRRPLYLGGEFAALTDGTPARGSSTALDARFHPPEAGQPVGAPVAVEPADTAAVAWVRGLPESVVWTLPEAVTAALDTAASFVVEAVSVTDETDPQVTLTVRNDGGRDGTFYANVSGSQVHDDNQVVAFEVPAGETVTHRERPGITAPAGEETRFVVDWSVDEAALSVRPD